MKKILGLTASVFAASLALSNPASAKKVTIAMANVDMAWLNTSKAVSLVCSNAKKASRKGAKLVVFAESFVGGYPLWHFSHPRLDIEYHNKRALMLWNKGAIALDGSEVRKMRACARSAHISMIVPINEKQEGAYNKTIFDTALFIDEAGRLKHVTRKADGVNTEKLFYSMQPKNPDIRTVRMAGLNVSYNAGWQSYSPAIRAIQYAQGVQLMIASTQDFGAEWESFMTAIANEGNVYVASTSNMYQWSEIKKADPDFEKEMHINLQTIHNSKTSKLQPGLALFVAPGGKVLKHSKPFESKIVYGVVDTNQITTNSLYRDNSTNYRLPMDVSYRGRKYIKDGYPTDRVIK